MASTYNCDQFPLMKIIFLLQIIQHTLSETFTGENTLIIKDLSVDFDVYSYDGVSAYYDGTLYAFNGRDCNNSDPSSCTALTTSARYTLDISQYSLSSDNTTITPSATSWQIFNNLNDPDSKLGGGINPFGCVRANNYVWVVHPGCCSLANRYVLKYNLVDGAYVNKGNYAYQTPKPKMYESCAATDGTYIYSIGGRDGINTYDQVWRYPLNGDTINNIYPWELIANMTITRHSASCIFHDDILYVLGGKSDNDKTTTLNSIEFYNDNTASFELASVTLYEKRSTSVSYIHPNNWIITIGGRDENNEEAGIELYDPSTARIVSTTSVYPRRKFYSGIYRMDDYISIIYLWGGTFNEGTITVYNDIKYIILSKDDDIFPTVAPTSDPTIDPTSDPTNDPTTDPTDDPTKDPTTDPTRDPTSYPTQDPTDDPTTDPTHDPTGDPTADPTKDPTTDPTDNPSTSPTLEPTYEGETRPPTTPTKEPTDEPSVSPTSEPTDKELVAGEPTAAPTIDEEQVIEPTASTIIEPTAAPSTAPTDKSSEDEQGFVASTETDKINGVVNVLMVILISICVFVVIVSYLWNSCMYKGCDPPNYFALLWVIMEIYDFVSDVSFSVYLYYLSKDDNDGVNIMTIFVICSIFIYGPYLLNLSYLTHRINRWKRKLGTSAIGQWLTYWDWWLICLAMLTGGSHPAVELCNSLLFPIDAFGMHLPWNEIVRIRTERFCTTVLFENVPQLCLQLYLLAAVAAVQGGTIIYLTILSSIGSIAFSGLYYFVNQHKIKLSKNHWIFRIRLTSNDIAPHHKHSYYKLQTSIANALELPNVEWVRITSVQYKLDELRCDGFISIPEAYLKKNKKDGLDPKDMKNEDDMRRLSAMYRNSFDDDERNAFGHRIETLKDENSHYHTALVKQIKYDLKLSALKIDFEIGGAKNREGGHAAAASADFYEEGAGDVDHDDLNNTLSVSLIPGDDQHDKAAAQKNIIYKNGNNNGDIQIQMVQHLSVNKSLSFDNNAQPQRSVSDLGAKAENKGIFGNNISSMAVGNDVMIDDIVNDMDGDDGDGDGNIVTGGRMDNNDDDSIDKINNDVGIPAIDVDSDPDIDVIDAEPGSPEPAFARTDDGMFDAMLNHDDGFKLNDDENVLTPSEKNKNNENDVDEEVMMELAKETPNIDSDDKDDNDIEISGDDDLSFDIETMQ